MYIVYYDLQLYEIIDVDTPQELAEEVSDKNGTIYDMAKKEKLSILSFGIRPEVTMQKPQAPQQGHIVTNEEEA